MTRFFTDCGRCGANCATADVPTWEEYEELAKKAGWSIDPVDDRCDRCPKCVEQGAEAASSEPPVAKHLGLKPRRPFPPEGGGA